MFMFILVVLFILMSVYVAQNKKLKDNTKTGWFIFLVISCILMSVFEVL